MRKFLFCIQFCCILVFSNLIATSVDGTTESIYSSVHKVLRNNDFISGIVRLKNGFTVVPGANQASCVDIDTCMKVGGYIDLRESSKINLLGDITLDSNSSFSSSGCIRGNGCTIFLSGNLILPPNVTLKFEDQTVIDALGHDIQFGDGSQFFIDTNSTLTIRNALIRYDSSGPGFPPINGSSTNSQIVVDEVDISMSDDMYCSRGSMFIHNEVCALGNNNKLFYTSVSPIYIASGGCLVLDKGTAFCYNPGSSKPDLVNMMDGTSNIYVYGADITCSTTGLLLTGGSLWFDNVASINSNIDYYLSKNISNIDYFDYGSNVKSVNWHFSSRYFAVGGYSGNLDIFSFDKNSCTSVKIQTINYGGEINQVLWSPDGRYIAVVGNAADQNLKIYFFNANTYSLTFVTGTLCGTEIKCASWAPGSSYLIVGCTDSPEHLKVFNFDNVGISQICGYNTDFTPNSVKWYEDGKFVALCESGTGIKILNFNGSSLNLTSSYPDSTTIFHDLDWNPDGTKLAVGAEGTRYQLKLFDFDGSDLYLTTSIDYCSTYGYLETFSVNSVDWTADGRYICAGGSATTKQIKFFPADLNLPADYASINYSASATVNSVCCGRDKNFFIAGGTSDMTYVYNSMYQSVSLPAGHCYGLRLGDPSRGSKYMMNVSILSGPVRSSGTIFINGRAW